MAPGREETMTGPLLTPIDDRPDESCPVKVLRTCVLGILVLGGFGALFMWLLCEGISRVMELRGF